MFQRMQHNASASRVVKLDAPTTLSAASELGLLPKVAVDPRQMPKPLTQDDVYVTLANFDKI